MSPVSMVTRCDLSPASLSPQCSSLAPVTLKHVHFLINDSQIQLAHVRFHFDPFTNVHTHSYTHMHALFKGSGVYDWGDRSADLGWNGVQHSNTYNNVKNTLFVFSSTWEWAFHIHRGNRSSFMEFTILRCHVSTVAQMRQTILTLKMTCHCFHVFLQLSRFFEVELRVFK